MLFSRIFLAQACASVVSATLQIVPGGTWTATNTGKHVQAHGAGVIQVDGTYYLIGEDKTSGSAFQNINCYSSKNLVEWTYVGALLTRQSSGDLGPNRVVERPKVIYNTSTKQYVLWMHMDSSDYGEARVAVATGNSVCGQYSYRGSWRPLGHESRDMGLFKDDDGTGYLLTEDRPNGLRINKLTSDYLNVSSSTYLWKDSIEAPAMIKKNGVYFMFGSHLTGWDTNDNVYSTASSVSGPWSAWKSFAPSGTKTYNSQTNFILPLSNTNNVMYMGDRWHSNALATSTYIWLPLQISGTSASMPTNYVNWRPDSFGAAPSETSYEGESATLAGGAKTVDCSNCSGKKAAGYVGGSTGGSVTFSGVRADAAGRTTVRVKFENGNTVERQASVRVNGGAAQTVAFLPSADGNTPESSSLNVDLRSGTNEIVFSGINGGWGPDVDRLMVPLS